MHTINGDKMKNKTKTQKKIEKEYQMGVPYFKDVEEKIENQLKQNDKKNHGK